MKAEEFVKEMKDRYEEAKVVLVKSQEEMKRQADRNRKEVEEYRVGYKVLISTKDFSIELMKRVTEVDREIYWTLYSQENYIRKCSRVGITGIVKDTSSG